MEIGVGESQRINLPIENDPEIIAAISMAVQKTGDLYEALYRQVQSQREEGQLVYPSVLEFVLSENGIDFQRSGIIPVRPSKRLESDKEDPLDRLAVEDPTIVRQDNGLYYVFHSAVRPKTSGPGVEVAIQLVTGKSLRDLGNKQTILTPQEVRKALGENTDMVKEPEFYWSEIDKKWYMIYEHTARGFSEIATAESHKLEGPYTNHRPLLQVREGKWDSQHLSPGPLLPTSKDWLMFYNGRGEKNQLDQTPAWSIGVAIIDGKTGAILERSENPIIRPPDELGPDNQLIAFANSMVRLSKSKYRQILYYTVADKRMEAVRIIFGNL